MNINPVSPEEAFEMIPIPADLLDPRLTEILNNNIIKQAYKTQANNQKELYEEFQGSIKNIREGTYEYKHHLSKWRNEDRYTLEHLKEELLPYYCITKKEINNWFNYVRGQILSQYDNSMRTTIRLLGEDIPKDTLTSEDLYMLIITELKLALLFLLDSIISQPGYDEFLELTRFDKRDLKENIDIWIGDKMYLLNYRVETDAPLRPRDSGGEFIIENRIDAEKAAREIKERDEIIDELRESGLSLADQRKLGLDKSRQRKLRFRWFWGGGSKKRLKNPSKKRLKNPSKKRLKNLSKKRLKNLSKKRLKKRSKNKKI